MSESYDLIVLGGGPAGYSGAIRAAQLGARVALVEGDRLGGVCLNRGCIPTKALVESARLYARRDAFATLGLQCTGLRFDQAAAVQRKDSIVAELGRGLAGVLRSHGIAVYAGKGIAAGPGRVAVGETELTAPRLLLATGSRPALPPIPGLDRPGVLSSDDILDLREQPRRLVIIGGGVIGVEIAGIFAAAGCQVTVAEALPRILPGADAEMAGLMVRELAGLGVQVLTGAGVETVAGGPGAMQVNLVGAEPVAGDLVLVATGRRPNLEGLEAFGLSPDGVRTDDRMLTAVPGVAAAGDLVAGRPMLAHVAFHEARVAAENLLGHHARMDYRAVPQCVFGPVDLAQVGLTEAEARQAGREIRIGRFPLAASGRAQTLGETAGLVKIISDARYDAVLGVHILGAHAAELLGEAALAVSMEATLQELTETMHMHPTLAEGIAEAALDAAGISLHLPRRPPVAAGGVAP